MAEESKVKQINDILANMPAPEQMDEEFKARLARVFTELLPAPEEIRDDWGRYIIDAVTPCGVWARKDLSSRDRCLVTISALTVLSLPKELKIYIGRALDNGVSRREIGEAIMHLAAYSGFPKSVEAMQCATEVFEARDTAEGSNGD